MPDGSGYTGSVADFTQANIDVVNRAYSAFASGDIAALLDTLSDDVEWSSPTTLPHGGEFSGRDDVLTEKFAERDGALKITKETGAFICRTS